MGSEVIEVVERRRRWPTEVRLEILDEVLQPGASVVAAADRHGVARGLIYQWLQQLRGCSCTTRRIERKART